MSIYVYAGVITSVLVYFLGAVLTAVAEDHNVGPRTMWLIGLVTGAASVLAYFWVQP